MKPKQEDTKEMVGGCCVCSDENGWAENPLVYCDGQGCNVAVHQACYGIVTVPTGSWFCRKCESQERAARVRCELCPSKDGALKRTDSGGWAHVVCALYIPEVRFGNVTTMEPIMLQLIPQERFNKSCYLCDEAQRGSKATIGACMQCNRTGCKNHFHVTCAQAMGLLCEEAGNYLDNVKYCGYCQYHYNKLLPNFQRRGSHVKTIPPYRPVAHDSVSSDEDKGSSDSKDLKLKKRSKSSPIHDGNSGSSSTKQQQLTREVKVNLNELPSVGASKSGNINLSETSLSQDTSEGSAFSLNTVSNSVSGVSMSKSDSKSNDGTKTLSSSHVPNAAISGSVSSTNANLSAKPSTSSSFPISSESGGSATSESKTITVTSVTFPTSSTTSNISLTSANLSNMPLSTTITASGSVPSHGGAAATSQSSATVPSATYTTTTSSSSSSSSLLSSSSSESLLTSSVVSSISTIVSLPNPKGRATTSVNATNNTHTVTNTPHHLTQPSMTSALPSNSDKDKHHRSKIRRNGPRSSGNAGGPPSQGMDTDNGAEGTENHTSKEGVLTICEEKNLSSVERENTSSGKGHQSYSEDNKLNVQYTPNVSTQGHKTDTFHITGMDSALVEPIKRSRSSSQDRGRRSKRGSSGGGGSVSKRGRVSLTSKESAKENRDSGASSPESLSSDATVPKRSRTMKQEIKEQKEPSTNSVITNGVAANTLLLGNQINPASAVAQKMTDTLNSELEAHSIYKDEEKVNTSLIGPALPGKRETSTPGVLSSAQPPPLPQNLEQLLERQWEQGSQFLMEQAQHFDIASLLSCLHQLRQENVRLEETVNSLVARRDHLLAVNARLSVPLSSSGNNQTSSGATTTSQQATVTSSSSSVSCSSSSVSITPAVSSSLVGASGNHIQMSSHSTCAPSLLPSRGHGQQQRHPSGGGGGSSHPSLSNAASSLSGRGASPQDRKGAHQAPLENGLAEPEYRYRSPNTDHQHRQQSPMLPPGAQPSPTSMRQSPASSGYHSGSSPHTGVPSLSPSGVTHPAPPPHSLVTHGHPPSIPSSSHSVALSRAPADHSRAELVRLASTQPHSNPGVGYPVYQMVSPPVPGVHHSPVGMPHSQVVRREVESGRSSHSIEKR